jgi:hypothetical protein
MELLKELYSDSFENIKTSVYRIADKDKMKALLKDMYSDCFGYDIPIDNGKVYSFVTDIFTNEILSMCQIVETDTNITLYDVCTPVSMRGKNYGSIMIKNIINFYDSINNKKPIELTVLCQNDIYYDSTINPNLENLIKFYSKLHFKINDIIITNKQLFVQMIYIGKVLFRLDVNSLINSNLFTMQDILSKNTVEVVEYDGTAYYNFTNLLGGLNKNYNVYSSFKKDSINNIFKNCLNPSIASFISERCVNLGLLIPVDEGADDALIDKHFYFMKYFEEPEKTYILYMGKIEEPESRVEEMIEQEELKDYEDYEEVKPKRGRKSKKQDYEEEEEVKPKRGRKSKKQDEEDLDSILSREFENEEVEKKEEPKYKRKKSSYSHSNNPSQSNNNREEFNFKGITLWLITPKTSNYERHIINIIPYCDNIVLPLALHSIYLISMLNILLGKGFNYFISKKYKDVCNFSEDINFKSFIFTKNNDLPKFEEIEPLLDIQSAYIDDVMGGETYKISRNELRRLKELLNKPEEYGDTYNLVKDNNGIKIAYTKELPVRGTHRSVAPGTSHVNFHVHPKYCNSTEKMLVAWPSGGDYSAVATDSTLFANHIKTHLCVTSSGIFFIKLSHQFMMFLQRITPDCKKMLIVLIKAYFGGTEDKRIIKNLHRYQFLKDEDSNKIEEFKRQIETQISDPDTCYTINQKLFEDIISEYKTASNNVTIKTILDVNNYTSFITEENTREYAIKLIKEYISDILNNFSCEKTMKEEISKDYPIYVITYASWETLFRDTYYKFK